MGVVLFALLLSTFYCICHGDGSADLFLADLNEATKSGKGIGISAKVAIKNNENTTTSWSIFDYVYHNDSSEDYDMFLDFNKDSSTFHRIMKSTIFGGTVHSGVGFRSKRFAINFGRLDRGLYKPMKTRYEFRPLFSTYCNFSTDAAAPNLENYKSSYKNYPLIAVPGPPALFSLTALLLLMAEDGSCNYDLKSRQVGSNNYKVFSEGHCLMDAGVDLHLGFEDTGGKINLNDLKMVSLSVQNEFHFKYFIHKIEYYDNPDTIRNSGDFQPHDGVRCESMHMGGEYSKSVEMEWPAHLSMSSEYLDYKKKEVSYLDELYNFDSQLSKINFRGVDLAVELTDDDAGSVDDFETSSSSVIVDHNSQLAFIKMEDKCRIISSNRMKFLRHGIYAENKLPTMEHPLEMFRFNETMTYKGFCEDAFGVPGKLYLSKASGGDDDEFCVANNEDENGWQVGAVDVSEDFLVPMWMSEYGYQKSEGEVTPEGHFVESLTNFLDVSNKRAMLDAFDVSHCFKSDHIKYYVLLANKKSNATFDNKNDDDDEDKTYHHEICISAKPMGGKPTKPVCSYLPHDTTGVSGPGFQATYNHIFTQQLAAALQVYPLRISHLTIDESLQFVVIAFSLIDFAGLSSYSSVNDRTEMKSNDEVEKRMKDLKGLVQVSYSVEDVNNDGDVVDQRYFSDSYAVFSYMEISSDTFEMITRDNGSLGAKGGHAMIIAMIVVSFVMAGLGTCLGLFIAYKLWRGATTFGYMIHSNVM